MVSLLVLPGLKMTAAAGPVSLDRFCANAAAFTEPSNPTASQCFLALGLKCQLPLRSRRSPLSLSDKQKKKKPGHGAPAAA